MSSSQNSRVIDPEGISYAVTNGHKDGEPKIIEPIGCAMRGRNPENPSERGRSNGKYKQRIEMGSNISNTITSVQKDSLVAEPMVIQKFGDRGTSQYSVRDIAHTIPANPMSDRGQLLAEPLRIPQATKQGYIEVPQGAVFDMSYPESTTRRGRVQEGGQVSPTLMAGGEAPCYFEGVSVHPNSHALEFKGQESIKQDAAPSLRATEYKAPHCVWEKVADELKQMATEARKEPIEVTINEHGSLRPHKLDKAKTGISEFQVENEEDTASTLISARPNKTYGYTTSYRIRKLTPRECFRLMGVTEADIDKIQQSGVSQSQQYKMAGNSIVVDCLYHMFRKMFTETACESQQLSLF